MNSNFVTQKKKLSGSENRKKRTRVEALNLVQAKSLKQYLKKGPHQDVNEESALDVTETVSVNKSSQNLNNQPTHTQNINENNCFVFDFEDPAKWPVLDKKIIQMIVEKGPIQVNDGNFPISGKRKFNPNFYFRLLKNGEKISRPWLIYSRSNDAVFCFCCTLFSKNKKNHSLTSTGFKDWSHIGRLLREHESNISHVICFNEWKDLDNGLRSHKTVDDHIQIQMSKEIDHWRNVLKRLVIFVQYLAQQNLALRGNSDKLYEKDNGNFLKLVETVSKFDLVLGEHIRRIQSDETNNTYLSKNIQNEIIVLLSNAIRKKNNGKDKKC